MRSQTNLLAVMTIFFFSSFLQVANGQVESFKLPAVMSDFAMNSDTGDVAAIDPEKNVAYLFAMSGLQGGSIKATKEVKVGATPVAITYKKYGKASAFAVVCSEDSHMYIIEAKKFKLIKKVPLGGNGVSSVVTSLNLKDPFIYYNYGGGHESAAGVVDLRKLVDRGEAFRDSMDCAISADGKTVYRRGPWSPSGFEALRLSNDFKANKPEFQQIHRDHRSSPKYVPGPFSECTAAGNVIYSADLSSKIKELRFVPECFFQSIPVVVGSAQQAGGRGFRGGFSGGGFSGGMGGRRGGRKSDTPNMRLIAASTNNFDQVGDPVLVSGLAGEAKQLARGVEGSADFKRVMTKRRFLADDRNRRVLCGFLDKLTVVPLKEFGLGVEPFMRARVSGGDVAEINKLSEFEISAVGSGVTVELEDLPEGAIKTPKGFQWKPDNSQVGDHKVSIKLKHGETEKVQALAISVRYPSTQLPFKPAGIEVNESGENLVFWSRAQDSFRQRPGRGQEPKGNSVGVVSFDGDDSTYQTLEVAYPVGQVAVFKERLALVPGNDRSRVEIFSLKKLTRIRSLIPRSDVRRIENVDGKLRIQAGSKIEVYDINTLKRVDSGSIASASTGGRGGRGFPDGQLSGGVVRSRIWQANFVGQSFAGTDAFGGRQTIVARKLSSATKG